jgi:hypothetical protein
MSTVVETSPETPLPSAPISQIPAPEYVARLVEHAYSSDTARTAIAFSERHLFVTEVTPYSRTARVVDAAGKVASWPLHATGLYDTLRWRYKEAGEETEKMQAWEAQMPTDTPAKPTPWEILGVDHQAHGEFEEQYFVHKNLGLSEARGSAYNPVTHWLKRQHPDASKKLADQLEAMSAAGYQTQLKMLKTTPLPIQAEVMAFKDLHGGHWRTVTRFIEDGVLLPPAEGVLQERETAKKTLLSELETRAMPGTIAHGVGKLALNVDTEPDQPALKAEIIARHKSEQVLAAMADLSLEAYVSNPTENMPAEYEALLLTINQETLAEARRAYASHRLIKDCQSGELETPVAITATGTLTGGVLTELKHSGVAEWIIQLGAGASDDGFSLAALVKGLGKKIRDASVAIPATLAVSALPALGWAMHLVNRLAESNLPPARALAGAIFEAGAVGIAWLGARGFAVWDGLKLKQKAEAHQWVDYIPVKNALLEELKSSELDDKLEKAKGLLEQSLVDQKRDGDLGLRELFGDHQKLKAARSMSELKTLITPPKHPNLTYISTAFNDNPFQRLFSTAQKAAATIGVLTFVVYPQIAHMPYPLDFLGGIEGFIATGLFFAGDISARIKHTAAKVKHGIGRLIPHSLLGHKVSPPTES